MREETRCRHMGYSFRLAARVLLYAQSHRQDSTYHGLCYTSRGALAGTRNRSMGPLHEGSIRRPIAPRANALTTELHLAPLDCVWPSTKCLEANFVESALCYRLIVGCFYFVWSPFMTYATGSTLSLIRHVKRSFTFISRSQMSTRN